MGADAPLVCIVTTSSDPGAVSNIRSYTERSVPIVVISTSDGQREIEAQLEADREVEGSLTFIQVADVHAPGSIINMLVSASAPGDLVLIASDLRVSRGWLARLRQAALSDSTVASASPLIEGTLDIDGSRDARSETRDTFAARIAERAQMLRPKMRAPDSSCVYIRRRGLDLATPVPDRGSLTETITALGKDLLAAGMVHVLADDVVLEGSSTPPSPDAGTPGVNSDEVLDERGSLRRAKLIAQVATTGLSVTIDGRALVDASGGTQTYIIGLIVALAQVGGIELRVVIPPNLSERASAALAPFPDVGLLPYRDAVEGTSRTHIVHRPQQIFTPDDLALLRLLGERVIIGQQDLIAYHNHSYHPDLEAWRAYRRTTRIALAVADQAIFFSEHARRDALGEDLLAPTRTHVVGVGREPIESPGAEQSRPESLAAGEHFLLCLGADYAHKNRPFAIELLHELRALGWGGRLVLAGTHVPHGSSQAAEQRMLGNVEDESLVIDLGPVDEATRRWLYAHARALVYPTTYEGFGLLPLEAARAGLPCLFAAQASLAEIAGVAATLVPWDARASAEAVLPLLGEGVAREAHLRQLRDLTIPSWSEVAGQLIAVYEQAVAQPGSEAAPRLWQDLERERYIVRLAQDIDGLKATALEYQDLYHSLQARVRGGLALIDEDGLLTPAQQRGLMRVAVRRRFAGIALAPFGLIGRLRRDRSG